MALEDHEPWLGSVSVGLYLGFFLQVSTVNQGLDTTQTT